MSHTATNWAVSQRGLKPSTKIVLWHLCDRHHKDNGCFPSQDTLAYDCEMSRSTVNVHLSILEERGLIRRVRQVDTDRQRQRPTRYVFAFEFDVEGEDDGGDGGETEGGAEGEKSQKPCPESGHGAVSEKSQKPCPKNRKSRVRNPDTNPVREPERNPARGAAGQKKADQDEVARFWAGKIAEGAFVAISAVTPAVARRMVELRLVDRSRLRDLGITC